MNEHSELPVTMAIGLPVYIEVYPDGEVTIEVDLSEATDYDDSATYGEDGMPVEELSEAAVARVEKAMKRLLWTAKMRIQNCETRT